MKHKILLTFPVLAILAISMPAGATGSQYAPKSPVYIGHGGYDTGSNTNKDGQRNWRYGEGENTTSFKISSATTTPTATKTATPTASPTPRTTASPTATPTITKPVGSTIWMKTNSPWFTCTQSYIRTKNANDSECVLKGWRVDSGSNAVTGPCGGRPTYLPRLGFNGGGFANNGKPGTVCGTRMHLRTTSGMNATAIMIVLDEPLVIKK